MFSFFFVLPSFVLLFLLLRKWNDSVVTKFWSVIQTWVRRIYTQKISHLQDGVIILFCASLSLQIYVILTFYLFCCCIVKFKGRKMWNVQRWNRVQKWCDVFLWIFNFLFSFFKITKNYVANSFKMCKWLKLLNILLHTLKVVSSSSFVRGEIWGIKEWIWNFPKLLR